MSVARITREELVEESVEMYLREQILTVRGYPSARVEFTDAFVERRLDALTKIDKNYLAIGFNFDDGGTPAELGSDLVRRTYTIEVWVIGTDVASGRNLANAVRDAAENDTGLIPLRDIREPGAPVIDYLLVDTVRAARQPVADPRPWQEALWIVHVPVVDEYYAGQS
jgi:hypothetical protein